MGISEEEKEKLVIQGEITDFSTPDYFDKEVVVEDFGQSIEVDSGMLL